MIFIDPETLLFRTQKIPTLRTTSYPIFPPLFPSRPLSVWSGLPRTAESRRLPIRHCRGFVSFTAVRRGALGRFLSLRSLINAYSMDYDAPSCHNSRGRWDVPVHEVAVNPPLAARRSLPDDDPFAGVQDIPVGPGCSEVARVVR
jgi:hypothetical protein